MSGLAAIKGYPDFLFGGKFLFGDQSAEKAMASR